MITAEFCRDEAERHETFASWEREDGCAPLGVVQSKRAKAFAIAARVLDRGATAKLRDIFRHHYNADPCERGFVTATEAVLAYLRGDEG